MDAVLLDQLVSTCIPSDFAGYLNQLWPLFAVGILLGVLAWLVSITVYTVLRIVDKGREV